VNVYDKNGYPIFPGDTPKIFHFIGARRKKYYMYKFVKSQDTAYLTVMHLDELGNTYRMLKDDKIHGDIEIVQGYGGTGEPFDSRVKAKQEAV